jgi:universal stress protein F
MTNSVLCAVDISNGDDHIKAIQTAARLADMDEAQLDVITVVPDFGMSQVSNYFSNDHRETMIAEAKTHLNALVIKSLGADQNSKIRHVVACGRAYEEVLSLAAKTDTSLIVVGAQKADLADFLLGPNAARIVRHANCSVFVVR